MRICYRNNSSHTFYLKEAILNEEAVQLLASAMNTKPRTYFKDSLEAWKEAASETAL